MTRFSLLIVDDEASDRFVIKRLLKRTGLDFQIDECSDGVEALQFLIEVASSGQSCPDLILLDLNMPRVGGLEFLQKYEDEVSRDPQMQSPVLMMLTSASREDENACLRFHCVKGIVSKDPDHPDDFANAVSAELCDQPKSQA